MSSTVNRPPASGAAGAGMLDRIEESYFLRLGMNLVEGKPIYDRIIERVTLEGGYGTWEVSLDGLLPTLGEAFPSFDDKLLDAVHARMKTVAVPLLVLLPGQLLTGLSVTSPDDVTVRLSGHVETRRRRDQMFSFAWQLFEEGIRPHLKPEVADASEDLGSLGRRHKGCRLLDPAKAVAEAKAIAGEMGRLADVTSQPVELLIDQMVRFVEYLTRHRLLWAEVGKARPGDRLRLSYSYITPYAHDVSSGPVGLVRRNLGRARSFVGQDPMTRTIPAVRVGHARSYHFETTVPPDCYVRGQSFVLSDEPLDGAGGRTEKGDRTEAVDWKGHVAEHGATTVGVDTAGQPFVHLYARDLPQHATRPIQARITFAERPPGTTAVVLWMLLFATSASGAYWFLWEQVTRAESRGVDLAALFVALPALALIWFARALRDDVRPRLPLVSRLGMVCTGLGSVYALASVLVYRSICVDKAFDGNALGRCPWGVKGLFGSVGVATASLVLGAMLLVVASYRVIAFVTYRGHLRKLMASGQGGAT